MTPFYGKGNRGPEKSKRMGQFSNQIRMGIQANPYPKPVVLPHSERGLTCGRHQCTGTGRAGRQWRWPLWRPQRSQPYTCCTVVLPCCAGNSRRGRAGSDSGPTEQNWVRWA
jgi:hypothetical protein